MSYRDLLTHKRYFCLLAMACFLIFAALLAVSAKDVLLVVDGEDYDVRVYGGTVGDVLDTAGIELESGDVVRPGIDSKIYDGSVVVVAKKERVTIFDGNEKKVALTAVPSVAELLCAQGITLEKDDLVKAQLSPGSGQMPSIRVIRRSIDIFTERKEIPYTVERVADKNLAPFESRVVQKGITGILENKIRVVTENGKETQRKLIETRTLRKPRKELIRYSTKVASRGSASYRMVRELTMQATAYTHTGHRTATGTWPTPGTVAVDPKVIPLGTPLYIEGYGFATARDTGGAIRGRRLDVFFNDKKNALKWGKRTVQVRILRKIN